MNQANDIRSRHTTFDAPPTPVEEEEQVPARATESALPLHRVALVDEERAGAIDPTWPSIVPLWRAGTEALTIPVKDGATIAQLEPTDAGQSSDGDLTLEAYELLVTRHGTPDAGEISGEWDTEGVAAMAVALPDASLRGSALRVWRGELESRLRQAEAIGRWYGMSLEAISAVTGRPFVSRLTLLPACGMARELDRRKAEADKSARRAEKAAAEAAREASRPRTLEELGIDVVAVAKNRVGTTGPSALPYPDARRLWGTDTEDFYGWKTIVGLELPPFADSGIRSLGQDDLAPSLAHAALEPDMLALSFVREIRQRFARGLDLGPVTSWSTAGTARGQELAAAYAAVFVEPVVTIGAGARLWRKSWLLSALVRGLCLRPDLATLLVEEAIDAEGWRQRPRNLPNPMRLAEPGRASEGNVEVGELAVKAARGGEISVGCLLDPPAKTSSHPTKRRQ